MNTYTCSCVDGYNGVNCQNVADECDNNPCLNGGTFTEGGHDTYNCSCVDGYNGVNCQNDVDDCESKPCLNGGTCTDGGVNTYTCSCAGGYNGVNCQNVVHDCSDVLNNGHNTSGIYGIYLVKARKSIKVYCDMETDGGGWLVFQRRQDGSVDFNRDWASYKEGFGNVSGEFWLGNDNLHELTSQAKYMLRIDLEQKNVSKYVVYSNFAIASESEKYRLSTGEYSGTAGDTLACHGGIAFSIKDRYDDKNYAKQLKGAWWYGNCFHSNLNGMYGTSLRWYEKQFHKYYFPQKVAMKLRR
ncbi:Tenascin-R [Lamellibrachia satsuma]|nr:Tenascin-R [Lamellibrachia satsuma]